VSSFLEDLLGGGSGYRVKLTSAGASFQPTDDSDAALRRFQAVAADIIENDGDGYDIFPQPHRRSDQPGNLIDLVLIALH
jgi:hypothetical protein